MVYYPHRLYKFTEARVTLWQPGLSTTHLRPSIAVKIQQKRLASGALPQTIRRGGAYSAPSDPLHGGEGLATASPRTPPHLAFGPHQLAAPKAA